MGSARRTWWATSSPALLVLEDRSRGRTWRWSTATGGLVETVTFRTIVLRDLAGAVHIFRTQRDHRSPT